MVLVIDLALCAAYLAAQDVHNPYQVAEFIEQTQRWWNEINGPVTRGNNYGVP